MLMMQACKQDIIALVIFISVFNLFLVFVEEEDELGGSFMKEMLILSANSTALQVE